MIGQIGGGVLLLGFLAFQYWQIGSLQDDLTTAHSEIAIAEEINKEFAVNLENLEASFERALEITSGLQTELSALRGESEANQNQINSLRGKINEKLQENPEVVARAAGIGLLRWMRGVESAFDAENSRE